MKRKMKITISALAVMFVAAIAVAIASFSFAGNGDQSSDGTLIADASGSVGTKTIIDYIIENSYLTESVPTDPNEAVYHDSVYRIAEITSSDTPSTLKEYVESDDFKNYVIDGNKTIEKLMNEGKVCFKSYNCRTKNEEDLRYISNADLIYITNDANNPFTPINDLTEDLYDILHEYAVGSYKPLIIDDLNRSSSDITGSITMSDLAKDVFGPNEKSYYTFGWKDGVSVSDYLQHKSGSLYLGINGRKQQSKVWATVYAQQPTLEDVYAVDSDGNEILDANGNKIVADKKVVNATDPSSIARVLTISTSSSSTAKTDALLKTDGKNTEVSATDPLYYVKGEKADKTVEPYVVPTDSHLYKLGNDSVYYQYAYNNRTGIKPVYVQNDFSTLDNAEAVDFDNYDIIVIEDSCAGVTISDGLYKKFASAMYGKIHIVYNSSMSAGKTDIDHGSGDKRESNFNVLYYMVITTDNVVKYDNVLLTNRKEFSIITTSKSASTAKVIADLINASRYRGIGGNSSSSSMFTVLELQPCYPIDEEVAVEVGKSIPRSKTNQKMVGLYGEANYYTKPAEMVNGKTKEQLPENTQYYKWELSRAKIADALNIPYEKIKLVQMSTEEFAADKTSIFGTYDLIYIGGNTSALKKDVSEYKFMRNQYIGQEKYMINQLDKLPFYKIYSHNGDLVYLGSPNNQSVAKGNVFTASVVNENNQVQSTFTYLNGNDITYNRYQDLKEYIESGMPVVISKQLSDPYNLAKNSENEYLQNSIDPDSNMFKVLDVCKDNTSSKNSSIIWGFNQDSVEDVVSDGSLGDSLTGYVSVFTSDTKQLLLDAYTNGNKRPKLTVKKMPKEYNRFDESTRLTDRTLKFQFDVTNGGNCTSALYIDDDGNGKFDEDSELITTGGSNSLEYECKEGFFGPVYWMLQVTTKVGNQEIKVNQTGFSYVRNEDDGKQQVNVLQIMPEGGGGSQGKDSLYLCPVCAHLTNIVSYNPSLGEGTDREAYTAAYDGQYKATNNGVAGTRYVWNEKKGQTETQELYIGKHEHEFGINAFDSNIKPSGSPKVPTGADNFDVNLADEISYLYDWDIDIIRSDEIQKWSKEVRDAYKYKVNADGTISSNLLTIDDMRADIKAGLDENASGYDEFVEILSERWNSLTKTEKEKLISDKYAKLSQQEKNAFDQDESEDKNFKLVESELIGLLLNEQVTKAYKIKKSADFSDLAATNEKYLESKNVSVAENEEKLNLILAAMIINSDDSRVFAKSDMNGRISREKWISELTRLKKENTGYYYEYYTIGKAWTLGHDISSNFLKNDTQITLDNLKLEELYPNTLNTGSTVTITIGSEGTKFVCMKEGKILYSFKASEIDSFISDYYHANDDKIEYKDKVKYYKRLAAGTDWLEDCYSTVVFGPAEGFNGKDIKSDDTLDDLENYIKNGHQVVLFHDTLTAYVDAGASKLTARLRSYFGMDRYHKMLTETEKNEKQTAETTATALANQKITEAEANGMKLTESDKDDIIKSVLESAYSKNASNPKISSTDSSYVKYSSYNEADSDKYFMTSLSTRPRNDKNRYSYWASDVGVSSSSYLTSVAYTDSFNVGADGMEQQYAMPYKYADLDYQLSTVNVTDAKFDLFQQFGSKYGTNKASQNNKGCITSFPFTIASELNIAPTHGQVYAADLEDDNMTVWYSLAGGDSEKPGSSLYAASPRDAMDNYFLYSYGNVFYCGAGHADVLGLSKDNNDERYLFINILCNSVRQSVKGPKLNIYDYGTDSNIVIKKEASGYSTTVEDANGYPEFSFKADLDTKAVIQSVKIFYDLDYLTTQSDKYNDKDTANHILIASWNVNNVKSGVRKDVYRYDSTLIPFAVEMDGNGQPKYDANGEYIYQTEKYMDGDTEKTSIIRKLKLQPSYFAPYNNEYTYIVIEVTDTNGKSISQRIKIKLKPYLFDLT